MKATKIKAETVILRWNGVSNDECIVSKTKGKDVTILVPGGEIRIKKEEIKWQTRYLYDEEKWIYYWKAPVKNVIEILAEKTEGNWIKTYDRAGELVSMKMTEEAHSQMGQKLNKY